MQDCKLYDVTFRDGIQQQGIEARLEDSISGIKLLDKLGMHYIEAGFVNAREDTLSNKVIEAACKMNLQSRIAAFGRTRNDDVGRMIRIRKEWGLTAAPPF